MSNIILEMKNISKSFPGVRALNDVNLLVCEGEIHALVGENGAGKSTLMNILSGVYPHGSYEGEIIYRGGLCKFRRIKDSEEKGIVIIHQELALVPLMTIGENMYLGNERGSFARIDWDETYDRAGELLKTVGLSESPRTLVKEIGIGQQQLVEIAKALAKKAGLLILDEPTAALNESDSQKLLELLLQFKKEGMTSIIISHKLNEISYVADKITIIRDGAVIETLTRGEDDFSEKRIVKGMVGRPLTERFPPRGRNIGEVSLEVRDWTVYHPLYTERKVCDGVNLYLRSGEIAGISGLMGAGRTELATSLFGGSYGAKISGEIRINGEKVRLKNVKAAIDNKIAYVTEDRKGNGLILDASICFNTTLAKMGNISRRYILDKHLELRAATEQKERLRIKCTDVEQKTDQLSGGNQQKVLLGKWMFAEPEIFILDEPTRGIDVGAKYEVYCAMNRLVAEGKSVLMISSELPELLGMCDRIYVMNEGRIIAELPIEEAGQEVIMTLILQSGKGARPTYG